MTSLTLVRNVIGAALIGTALSSASFSQEPEQASVATQPQLRQVSIDHSDNIVTTTEVLREVEQQLPNGLSLPPTDPWSHRYLCLSENLPTAENSAGGLTHESFAENLRRCDDEWSLIELARLCGGRFPCDTAAGQRFLPVNIPRSLLRENARRVAVLSDDWFYCYPPTGEVFRVPRTYETDFASIPSAVHEIAGFDPFGLHAEAAVIHDWLYSVGEEGARSRADDIFLYAMREQGVPLDEQWPMYLGVRAGGERAYGQEAEWTQRFRDPVNLTRVPPPFSRPSRASVATISCSEFESRLPQLREEFASGTR